LILHGRRICRPKPLCPECVVQEDCEYFHAAERLARPIGPARKKAAPKAKTKAKPKSKPTPKRKSPSRRR